MRLWIPWLYVVGMLGLGLAGASAYSPLIPSEIVVVANTNFEGSEELARHYMRLRDIPEEHLLATTMPVGESISRREYEDQIARPLREFLIDEKLAQVRCVVLMHGVPLRVWQPQQTVDQRWMETSIREVQSEQLEVLLEQVEAAHALARAPGEPNLAELPEYDPKAPVRKQIEQLEKALLEGFRAAIERIATIEDPAVQEALTERWVEHWQAAYGELPPAAKGIRGAPSVPSDLAQFHQASRRAEELMSGELTTQNVIELLDLLIESQGAVGTLEICELLLRRVKPDWQYRASVGSELSVLFWERPPLFRWVPNPLNLQLQTVGKAPRTLMVCRLDGPNEILVRTMIDTTVAVEQTGLKGKAYIDARGRYDYENGYGRYDADLRRLARILEEATTITTVLENSEKLFRPGDAPDAALYCGWYSLGRYVDAFEFNPGAVGYHIASVEASSLRDMDQPLWAPQLIIHGAVATLGPVEEPYLRAFPSATYFFGLLATGEVPLVEAYYQSLPYLSWMMTLVGDPLYRPYRAQPQFDYEEFLGMLGRFPLLVEKED